MGPTNEPLKADILSSVGKRDVAKKEGRKMISMRGTQPILKTEDGNRNVAGLDKLGTVLCSQPTKQGDHQS